MKKFNEIFFFSFDLLYLFRKTFKKPVMENIKNYYQMVDNCIKQLGVDPEQCRGEKEGQWDLRKGSANVWIDVFKVQDQDYGYFQCMSPVCEIPTSGAEPFLNEILEINHTLYGVGMTKFKNWIYVKTIRELDGISEEEILAAMKRIGGYADDYDDYLKNKYLGGAGAPPK